MNQRSAVLPPVLAMACALALGGAACDALDGGLVPVKHLPPPHVADTTGDGIGGPSVAITSPTSGATVDADFIPVELAVSGFTLDDTHGVAVTVLAAGVEPRTVLTRTTSAVVTRAPEGQVMLRATLVEGSEATEIYSEIPLVTARTHPTVTIDAPVDQGIVPADAGALAVTLTLHDFTLLADGAAPTGPRQGRVLLAIDGVAAGAPIGATTASLPLPSEGAHQLTATLVDADGIVWEAAATDSASFEVRPAPRVSIVTPAADAELEGARVTVTIAPVGFVTDGLAQPGHGTFQVKLDGTVVASKRTGTTLPLNGIAGGAHTLEVALTDSAGAALVPPATASVSFTNELLPPTVDLVLPATTTIKEGARVVAIVPHHFALSPLAIPGPFVPGTGGWQVLVDDVVKADKLITPQATIVLAPGSHTIKARLVDTTGAALSPTVEALRTFDVRPLETAVTILAPADNATVAKDFTVAVAFQDFTLSPVIIAPGDPVVAGVGHFHAFLRKQGDATFEYQGFYLSESFQLHVTTPGVYEVKVALHYQNHTPVLPAVEAVTTVNVSDVPGIRIQSPRDGATLGSGPLAVAVAVDNFTIIPIPRDGSVSDTKGHYHLFIDGAYQGFFLTPVAILDPAATSPPLTAGSHHLEALLHRSDHSFITGSVGDALDFTYDPRPTITILAPTPDAVLAAEPFEVHFATRSFTLADKAGQANVAGEGHVHVFVDDVYQDFETSDRFQLLITDPGTHTIKITPYENDHSAIPTGVSASVKVVVDAVPRVRFLAPVTGSFTYGGDVDFMLDGWNVPAEADVQVVVDGTIAYVGPIGADGLVDLVPLDEGVHTATATPLGAGGDPLIGAVPETITFETIGVDAPSLAWVTPGANATVLPGAPLTIGVTGFTLDDGLARRPAVPGDGLWTLSVGARTWGPFAGPTATLPALPKGPATLVAELWHRDGSRVMPRRAATRDIVVGGAGPAVSIASPGPDESWYGPVPVTVDSDFGFGVDDGWLSVKVDGEQFAFAPSAATVLVGLAVGQHSLEVELIGPDREPLVPAVTASGTFRVGGASIPTVTLDSPGAGAAVGSTVQLGFTLGGLVLDPAGTGGRRQPGRGAVLVMVDGRVAQVATASPVTVSGLTAGKHTLGVALAGLDLVPIAPPVSATVSVTVN